EEFQVFPLRSRESDPKRGPLTFNSGAEDQIDSVVAFVGINPNHRRELARIGCPFSWHGSLRALAFCPHLCFSPLQSISISERRDVTSQRSPRGVVRMGGILVANLGC